MVKMSFDRGDHHLIMIYLGNDRSLYVGVLTHKISIIQVLGTNYTIGYQWDVG